MTTTALLFTSAVMLTTGVNAFRSLRSRNEKAFFDNLGVFLAFGIYVFVRLTILK